MAKLSPRQQRLMVQTKRGERNLAKGAWVVLGHNVASMLIEWMEKNGQDDLNEALRALIVAGMSSMPDFALQSLARKRAYDQCRKWLVTEMFDFFKLKLDQLEEQDKFLAYMNSQSASAPEGPKNGD